MAQKRIKVKDDLYTILTFDQADTHLAKIGTLIQEKEAAEAEANAIINQAKADLKKRSAPITEKIQKHVRSLEHYCNKNREAFGRSQSMKRLFGRLGWRRSTSISVKKSTLQKIKDVFKSKATSLLHIKETPDKEALAKLTDEQLVSVDARRVLKEEFFAEPDLTVVPNE